MADNIVFGSEVIAHHPEELLSLPKPQSGKMTQVPMFTSKGCDIGRDDARRVDTQKIL